MASVASLSLAAPSLGARRDGVRDAVREVLVEQAQADGLQRAGDGADLGEHVDAVGVLVDHPRDAADLPLDARHPGQVGRALAAVALRHVVPSRPRRPLVQHP